MLIRVISVGAIALLASCATQEVACEDARVASEQHQQCISLQRQIVKAKGQPILRTELERRYQTDCVDVRYYRDDQQIAVCGNKQKIDDAIDKQKETQSKN